MRVWVIKDKTRRCIFLSHERWRHINQEHPEISEYFEELKYTLEKPLKISTYENDEKIKYYYKYFKQRNTSSKYLLIIVKYLNGKGFIITAYFVRNIK
ncbi:hypothetical protein HZA97_01850 [Candidatus Woesearchaeota archaeon]|nr:hypothetical protein [Candidatus Woesearchaeota archaeon]